MALIALIAGTVTWVVASFEPGEAPAPARGVPNSGTRAAAPAVEDRDRQYQPTEVAPVPTAAPVALVDGEVPTEERVEQADDHAQQWARAREQVQIEMYATPECDVCRQAREYMQDNGIAFTEHNVEEDEVADRRLRELSPERTIPTFEIDELILMEFSPEGFEATRTQAARHYLSESDN
jgi:glutaredoxin